MERWRWEMRRGEMRRGEMRRGEMRRGEMRRGLCVKETAANGEVVRMAKMAVQGRTGRRLHSMMVPTVVPMMALVWKQVVLLPGCSGPGDFSGLKERGRIGRGERGRIGGGVGRVVGRGCGCGCRCGCGCGRVSKQRRTHAFEEALALVVQRR